MWTSYLAIKVSRFDERKHPRKLRGRGGGQFARVAGREAYFHGTRAENVGSILQGGLMRGGGFKTVTGRRVAQVYVTRDKQMAALVGAVASLMHGRGDGKFAVLTVRIPGMQMRLDPEDSGGKSLIAQASIAPAQIRQIGRYRIIPAVLAEAKRLRKHKNDLYAEVRRKGGYRGMTADFAADMGWQSYMRDLGAAAGDRRIRSGTWYRQTHKAIAEEFYSPVFGDAVAAAENFAAVGE